MPRFSQAFPSRFLKAADLNGREHHLRIAGVEQEEVGTPPKPALVVSFANRSKSWVLNKTNGSLLAAAYGDDTDGWINRDVILFETVVDYRGTSVPAIRCRIPRVATPAKPNAMKVAPPTEPVNAGTDNVVAIAGNSGTGHDDMNDEIPW